MIKKVKISLLVLMLMSLTGCINITIYTTEKTLEDITPAAITLPEESEDTVLTTVSAAKPVTVTRVTQVKTCSVTEEASTTAEESDTEEAEDSAGSETPLWLIQAEEEHPGEGENGVSKEEFSFYKTCFEGEFSEDSTTATWVASEVSYADTVRSKLQNHYTNVSYIKAFTTDCSSAGTKVKLNKETGIIEVFQNYSTGKGKVWIFKYDK